MRKEIQLYEYQKDMLRQIEDAFVTHQSVMVQMPTGTGKTILLAEVVKSEKLKVKNPEEEKSEKLKVKNPCVWIVVHRRELVEQIKETLAKQLDSSLFTLPSSLTPSDSSFFVLHSSLSPRVFSIQWLSRHYQELEERPSLIIIDEAHHALAKTYAEMMNAYPEAKKLGVTATPCRLNKRGFTNLFEVLLTSHSISNFIKDGYLSDFDYVSLNPNSEDQKKIDGLEKRATDGDYNTAEMQEVLDTRPTIERLFKTIGEFAEGKKGIVYAINIEHAEHIAEYYREHGLNAVAISSKTPTEERKRIIDIFRNTNCHELSNDLNTNDHELSTNLTTNCHEISNDLNTNDHELSTNLTTNCHEFKIQNSKIQNRLCRQFKTQNSKLKILINVDLFGEGFDCPDVEFIQLARPTLSLAKYLQMVGRGLRVAKNKECCTILDNVGLYRLFGLPNAERDWKAMFLGQQTGKGVADMARDLALRVCNFSENSQVKRNGVCNRDMVIITWHNMPRIAEQIAILLDEFGKAQNFKYEKHGLLGEHTYIRTSGNHGVYHILGMERLGWKLMYDLQTATRKYYLLNNESGRMLYVGRFNIWSDEDKVELKEFEPIERSDANIAKVRFRGDDNATWINLYTMQEFDVCPMIVNRGNMEFLRIGDELFSYKNRQIAGIPLTEQEIRLYASPMDKVELLQQHGFAMFHSRKKIDRELPWADLVNGIRFAKQPRVETHGFLEFSTTDGVRLYPRVQTRLMDNDSFVLQEALTHGIDDGICFRNFYIPPSDTPRLYLFKEKMDNMALFKDEDCTYYIRYGLEPKLTPISLEEWSAEKRKWKRMVADFEKLAEEREKTGVFKYQLQAKVSSYKLTDYNEPSDIRITRNGKAYNTFCFDIRYGKWKPTGSYTEFSKQAYGIRVVRNWEGKYLLRTLFFEKFSKEEDPKFDFAELLDEAYLHIIDNGREYFVDLESNMCFDKIPEMIKIGFMIFQKDGDMYFPFNYRLNARRPFRRGEIIGGDDICFIGKHIVVLKGNSSVYYIRRRYTDGKRFVVSKTKQENIAETLYDLYYDGKNPAEIKARETHCI